MISDKLWHLAVERNPALSQWTTWLNKYGSNGTLLDMDDNTSFISPTEDKAVKILYEADGQFLFESWEGEFGDDEIGYINVLTVVFNHLDNAIDLFEQRLTTWL